MTDFSNYTEDAVTDWLTGKASMPATGTRYLAAFTAISDAEAGTGTEVSGGSYARVAVTSALGTSSGGAATNSTDVEFAEATGSWGTIVGLALFDAISGGNALTAIKAPTGGSIAIGTGEILRIPAGDLDFSTA